MPCSTGEDVLAGLLDAIVDRVADILERVQNSIDTLPLGVFIYAPLSYTLLSLPSY